MRTITYWEREVDEWLAQLHELRELHEVPPCAHELQSARLHLDTEQHLVANYVCDTCHRILGRGSDSYLTGQSLPNVICVRTRRVPRRKEAGCTLPDSGAHTACELFAVDHHKELQMNASAKAGPVHIGSTVTYTESATGEHRTVHIVASGESDPMHGLLSEGSPVGHALLGHRAGELVRLRVPRGERHLRIDSVL